MKMHDRLPQWVGGVVALWRTASDGVRPSCIVPKEPENKLWQSGGCVGRAHRARSFAKVAVHQARPTHPRKSVPVGRRQHARLPRSRGVGHQCCQGGTGRSFVPTAGAFAPRGDVRARRLRCARPNAVGRWDVCVRRLRVGQALAVIAFSAPHSSPLY